MRYRTGTHDHSACSISSHCECSRAASISFRTCSGAATIREMRLLFESGVYSVIYGTPFGAHCGAVWFAIVSELCTSRRQLPRYFFLQKQPFPCKGDFRNVFRISLSVYILRHPFWYGLFCPLLSRTGWNIVCTLGRRERCYGSEKLRRVAKLVWGLGKIPYYIATCLLQNPQSQSTLGPKMQLLLVFSDPVIYVLSVRYVYLC